MSIVSLLNNIELSYQKNIIIDNIQKNIITFPNISLIGIRYGSNNQYTDVESYIDNNHVLIIYNENFEQYLDKNDCFPGGGNGKMRQYRSDGPCTKINAFVLGIPTGRIPPGKGLDSKKDNRTYQEIVDDAIKQIITKVIQNPQIKYILWSVNQYGELGLDLFGDDATAKQTAEYITHKIKSIFTTQFYYPQSANIPNHGSFFDLVNLQKMTSIKDIISVMNLLPLTDCWNIRFKFAPPKLITKTGNNHYIRCSFDTDFKKDLPSNVNFDTTGKQLMVLHHPKMLGNDVITELTKANINDIIQQNKVYIYSILPSGKFVIGEKKTNLEFGAKHIILSADENNKIIIAGEIIKNGEKIRYNFDSGSYFDLCSGISNTIDKNKYRDFMEKVFNLLGIDKDKINFETKKFGISTFDFIPTDKKQEYIQKFWADICQDNEKKKYVRYSKTDHSLCITQGNPGIILGDQPIDSIGNSICDIIAPAVLSKKTYGLYIVPSDEQGNKVCTINNINYKGPHIPIASFNEKNNDIIIKILQFLEPLTIGIKHWKPNKSSIRADNNNIRITSSTLNNLQQFLSVTGLQNLHNKDTWRIYCDEGINVNVVDKTNWSLIMIEKDGNNITWTDKKINFHDIDNKQLNNLQVQWPNFLTTSQHVIFPDKMKILSWNISWEVMSGENFGSQCGKFPNNQCLDNIARFIESHGSDQPYDFVGLQEASKWWEIVKKSSNLQNMNNISYKPGQEHMVTFYNKVKYQLDDNLFAVCSYMENRGRSFMVLFFKQRLCLVNMHAGHKKDVDKFNIYWERALKGGLLDSFFDNDVRKTSITDIEKNQILHKINSYDIIILGDMNDELSPNIPMFFNKNFYGKTTPKTCCDKTLNDTGHTKSYDHILYSKNTNHTPSVYHSGKLYSDHLPVIAKIYR